MLDFAAHMDKDIVSKYGLEFGGAILAEEKHKPLFVEIENHPTLCKTPGGSGINSIRCANVSQSPAHSEAYAQEEI